MKIGFIFTEQANLADVPAGGRFRSTFEIPDGAKSLPDLRERIFAVADLVGQLTWANVHLDCPEIGLKNYPIKQTGIRPTNERALGDRPYAFAFHFIRYTIHDKRRKLVIYAQIKFPYSRPISLSRQLADETDPEKKVYLARIAALSEQLLVLLNADNPAQKWQFEGFDHSAWEQTLATRFNKRQGKLRSESRKREREEEKRKQREAKRAEKLAAHPPQPLTHGAGRTVGARPGIYNGVQMRSQLEIRFASELDERGIKWVYEGEALGESGYLVDFYLPDLSAWVEVKGRFEPRDRQVLPKVAKHLKTERSHRLLVYTNSGTCFVVNPSGFREVERKNFWGELLR